MSRANCRRRRLPCRMCSLAKSVDGVAAVRNVDREVAVIHLEVWLYGPVAAYAGDREQHAHASLRLDMPDGTTLGSVLDHLGIPSEEKGMIFVNGQLTDMPGLDVGRSHELKDGDRVGIFHRKTMWPFQYRHGASISPELAEALAKMEGGSLHHSPGSVSEQDVAPGSGHTR